jgi:flagellar protein FliO/FliZ
MIARLAASLLFALPALAGAAEASAPAASAAGSLLQVFIGLVAVLLLIAAMAWMAKRLGVARGGSSALLNVIASASVGTRERVVVLEIGESWMVVGVAPGSVNALATLPKGDIPAAASMPLPPFAARLQQMIAKRHDR